MVLVIEKKFLEGRWWKYGLGLAVLQTCLWMLPGYFIGHVFDPIRMLRDGTLIWGTWLLFIMLPFTLGRLGLRRIFWCGVIGFIIADLAYFGLALYTPVIAVNGLIPFIAFAQIYTTFISLGVIIEFGRYVYRRVFEE